MICINTSYRARSAKCVLSERFQSLELSKWFKLSAGALRLIFADDNEVRQDIDASLADIGVNEDMFAGIDFDFTPNAMQRAVDAYPDPTQRAYLQEILDGVKRGSLNLGPMDLGES